MPETTRRSGRPRERAVGFDAGPARAGGTTRTRGPPHREPSRVGGAGGVRRRGRPDPTATHAGVTRRSGSPHASVARYRERGDGRRRRHRWLHLRQSTRCDLRVDLGTLSSADVMLDGASPPQPDAASIELLVIERECASGKPATGRVRLVDSPGRPMNCASSSASRRRTTAGAAKAIRRRRSPSI